MAQTTGAISAKSYKVEVGTAGTTTWTDISGTFNQVTVSGGDRNVGEAYTADGDVALLGRGKRKPYEVDVKCIYTEITGEAFKVIHDLHVTAGGADAYVRLTPKGTATGDYRYTSSVGTITSCGIPQGEVSKGEVIMFNFKATVADLTQATAA